MLRASKRQAAAPRLKPNGRKDDFGKPMWSLLPWNELEEVVRTLNFGAEKYGVDNWKKVEDGERRYQDAAVRHLKAVMTGEHKDPETGLPHYAHAAASVLFAFYHNVNGRGKKCSNGVIIAGASPVNLITGASASAIRSKSELP